MATGGTIFLFTTLSQERGSQRLSETRQPDDRAISRLNRSLNMSDLQKAWAKKKMGLNGGEVFNELDEEELEEEDSGYLPELPEGLDDDSSSASSASSTGTVVPTPSRNLFARPLGYVHYYLSWNLESVHLS